jgi:hypothetical protein
VQLLSGWPRDLPSLPIVKLLYVIDQPRMAPVWLTICLELNQRSL